MIVFVQWWKKIFMDVTTIQQMVSMVIVCVRVCGNTAEDDFAPQSVLEQIDAAVGNNITTLGLI